MPLALFIEDNSMIRHQVVDLLELEGYEVLSALDPEAGLCLTQGRLPDVILCDIMMQGTDGYEVLSRLRADPLTTLIPFIYVTAGAAPHEVKAGLTLAANGYIKKPVEIGELFAAIDLCLIVP